MLLNKSYTQGDVITFKLVNGEEVIARYQGETMAEYIITKPVTLTPTPQGSLGMLPSMFSVELNTVNINLQRNAVAMSALTRKEVSDEYTRGTSGIKPASSLEGLLDAKSTQGRGP
jgi:hypothetical protein